MSVTISHNCSCDGCSQRICSLRYKCMQCSDYNLCSKCKTVDGVTCQNDHKFMKIGGDCECKKCRKLINASDKSVRHYKCLSCLDYDLCEECRCTGKHAKHEFILVEWRNGVIHALTSSSIHHWVKCSDCMQEISSVRYVCKECPDYNLCSRCQLRGKSVANHNQSHGFFTIGTDSQCKKCRRYIIICSEAARYYKCYTCPDYDLCQECYSNDAHPKHEMIRISWRKGALVARPATANATTASATTTAKNRTTWYSDIHGETVPNNDSIQTEVASRKINSKTRSFYSKDPSSLAQLTKVINITDTITVIQGSETSLIDSTRKSKSAPPVMVHTPHETDSGSVIFGAEIGKRSFGTIHKGWWNGIPVAIKSLRKGSMDVEDFLKEAAVMATMKHKNILTLLAVVSRDKPALIITEYMNQGTLLEYLKSKGNELKLVILIWIAMEVAEGMQYLESKNYVHRELSARKVLIGTLRKSALSVKICDFGLREKVNTASMVYKTKTGSEFSVKWTAPEALPPERKFTVSSDVWSFGVLLVEIVTLGSVASHNVPFDDVLNSASSDLMMNCPEGCPQDIYSIIVQTWSKNASDRPTFNQILSLLQDFCKVTDV